jgi:hypothetical protein
MSVAEDRAECLGNRTDPRRTADEFPVDAEPLETTAYPPRHAGIGGAVGKKRSVLEGV